MFKTFEVAPGVRVHVLRDQRLRRTHVYCFFSSLLRDDTASPLALLPAVLVRGTARLPKAHLLEREMSSLYGARMGAGVAKSGDRQLIRIGLNLPNEKYAGVPVLGAGLGFLRDVLADPWLTDGAFNPEYVSQEKMQLIGRIRAVINNKPRYAMRKGIQSVFAGEPAALSEQGEIADVELISPRQLGETHQWFMRELPVDLYIVGDVEEEGTAEMAAEHLALGDRRPTPAPKSIVTRGTGELRRFTETEPMEQGWIILGFKSGVTMGTPGRWALEVLNGALGGYQHSKLFTNVRERASLAYQAGSTVDATKGVIVAYAGIDPANYQRASDLMLEQLHAIARGELSDEDLGATKEAMATDLRLELDSPGALISTHVVASGEGVYEDVPSSMEALRGVTKDDVVAMAAHIRPDTLFFLSAMGDDQLKA